jgi:hypothetical protein
VAGADGNYVELAAQDYGKGVATLEEIVTAANPAFSILNAGATQFAILENGSTDAANEGDTEEGLRLLRRSLTWLSTGTVTRLLIKWLS